jgi:uncharacterized protein
VRRLFFRLVLILVLLGLPVTAVYARDYPSPQGYVNDFAGVLAGETVSNVERLLSALEDVTSAEVVVVTLDSLAGASLEEYAAGLFQAWGIGKKEKDNGVLFILAPQDKEVRIEVGYGLEPIITDGRAGRILDNEVLPYLRDGKYDEAVEAGILAIEGYIRDGSPPSAVEENPVQSLFAGFHLPWPLIIALGFITVYILGFMARTRSIWLGGVWGIILGIILGLGFGKTLFLITLPIGLGISGLFLDWILSSNYRGRSSGGLSTGWFSSRGGFSGPGGGFGGFGGGRSGGGGASRRW